MAYLKAYPPFDEPLVGKLELMNEFFNVAVIDTMFLLTDINTEKVRGWMVWVYIGLMAANICIHLGFLIYSSIRQLKINCRKKSYSKKYALWYEKQTQVVQS